MKRANLMPFWEVFGGVLTYELEKAVESKYIRLFIAWKYEGDRKYRVLVHFIEYKKKFDWDETALKEYYKRYADQLDIYTGPIKNTWLIPDGTVLMTRSGLNVTQGYGILNVTVSEGIRDNYTRRPVWFSPER
jgi:hypothetical protein